MTVFRAELEVKAEIVSPFLFPSLDAAGFGADVAALRDTKKRCLIPAEQIRGVMRHAWQDLYEEVSHFTEAILSPADIFGRESDSDEKTANVPRRGLIIFEDLTAETEGFSLSHRISIDEDTGAVKRGALMVLELAAPIGECVTFRGRAIVYGTEAKLDRVVVALNASASRVSAIGSTKSAGFGEVKHLNFSILTKSRHCAKLVKPKSGRLQLKLCLSKPFVVNARKEADNAFVGDPVIPGGAIKGALARAMSIAGEDVVNDVAFSALKISHARPDNWQGREVPLSVVANEKHVFDSLGSDGMFTDSADGLLNYQGDWKASWAIEKKVGITKGEPLRLESRAHVAISEVGQVAREAQLYFTSAVCPDDRWWSVTVDFSDVHESERARLHGWILQGSDWLGSTQATMKLHGDDPADSRKPGEFASGQYAITLETDAVLIPPSRETRASYAVYWENLLGGSLIDYCAREAMRGGWMGLHYRSDATDYQPFHVTCAGSVFLLEGSDEKKINEILESGLPQPVGTDWATCPFQPQNGFGEVRADWQGVPGGDASS